VLHKNFCFDIYQRAEMEKKSVQLKDFESEPVKAFQSASISNVCEINKHRWAVQIIRLVAFQHFEWSM